MARLDSVLSFSQDPDADRPANDEPASAAYDDDAGFEFAFAPPLTATAGCDAEGALLAPADDLFAHGRILPAYPVFDRRLPDDLAASTAPPSPDTYCAWAPRSAPGSPARGRDGHPFPKSASTGEQRRFWRLRDLVGGRSHSDGKEKFVFLQSKMSGKAGEDRLQAKKPSLQPQQPKQSKKAKAGAVTETDMATAHRLFYGKQGAGALPGGDRKQHSSYLPYRTGIVGFFATAHALGRSHHPY